MMDADIIRVIYDLRTFTAIDLAKALDWPEGTAAARLSDWCKTGHVERVKISRKFLYAIGPKAERIYAKLPPIDPRERCLPLSFDFSECEYHGLETIVTSGIVGMINHGATKVIRDTVICKFCGEVISQAEYTHTPF